jgi:hypothetical protein
MWQGKTVAQPGLAAWVRKEELTGGAHASVRKEREDDEIGRRKPKRKTYF